MLLDDDVVANGEAETRAFSRWFGREERIENLFLHLRRNASAIVSDRNFDMITKVFGGGSKPRFMASICFRTALRCSEKAVGNKIQQSPRNVLWE